MKARAMLKSWYLNTIGEAKTLKNRFVIQKKRVIRRVWRNWSPVKRYHFLVK